MGVRDPTRPDAAAELAWRRVVDGEQAARRTLVESPTQALNHAWWKSVADLLDEYVRLTANGQRPEPPPGPLLLVLARLAGELSVGTIPAPILEAAAPGRRPPGPLERRDIEIAVAYRRAASEEGLEHLGDHVKVDDATPVRTLCEWFGVKPSTVRGWSQRTPLLHLGRLTPAVLVQLAQDASARYRQAGRGSAAIADRSAKRRRATP